MAATSGALTGVLPGKRGPVTRARSPIPTMSGGRARMGPTTAALTGVPPGRRGPVTRARSPIPTMSGGLARMATTGALPEGLRGRLGHVTRAHSLHPGMRCGMPRTAATTGALTAIPRDRRPRPDRASTWSAMSDRGFVRLAGPPRAATLVPAIGALRQTTTRRPTAWAAHSRTRTSSVPDRT
jgi:hypothetical protein